MPETPLSYLGIVFLHLSSIVEFSMQFLVLWAVIVIAVQVLDYFIPVWGTKRFGGSKLGVWGCMIGVIAGLFLGPWGIVAGAFVGAFAGELLAGNTSKKAIRAAFGAFVGFLLGTVSQLIVAGFLIFYYVKALI